MPQYLPPGYGPFQPMNRQSLGGFAGAPQFLEGLDELDKLLLTDISGPVAAQASDVAAGQYYGNQAAIAGDMTQRGLLTSGAASAANAGNIAGLGEGLVGAGAKGTGAEQTWRNNALGSIEGLATGMSQSVGNQLGAKLNLRQATQNANLQTIDDIMNIVKSLFGQGGAFSSPGGPGQAPAGTSPFAGMASKFTGPVYNALTNMGSSIGSDVSSLGEAAGSAIGSAGSSIGSLLSEIGPAIASLFAW